MNYRVIILRQLLTNIALKRTRNNGNVNLGGFRMRKVSFWALTAALGLSVVPLISTGTAWADARVCYRTLEAEPTRIVLDVKLHSQLATTNTGGRQVVWDALGKHAYTEGGKNRMAVVDGAVVT